MYEDLVSSGNDQVKLIGVGKSQHMSSLGNWTNGNDASVCADVSPYPIWNEWGAAQRDLYILDHEGHVEFHENVTGGIPNNLESIIIDLVSQIPVCTDGEVDNSNPCNPFECFDGQWYEMIIDCAEPMGFPCEGGLYIPPAEGECCSVCVLFGDINQDGFVDILDAIEVVNLVLNGEYNELVDMNYDGTINILDIIDIIYIILN